MRVQLLGSERSRRGILDLAAAKNAAISYARELCIENDLPSPACLNAPECRAAEARRTTDEARRGADFFAVQTAGTVSFRTGWLGRFLCSGLEYQVEHHLFPNISHVYYPEISV